MGKGMMKRALQWLSLAVLVTGTGWWLLRGPNLGWTKTSVPVKFVDEVTGIEGANYQERFVPGLDFLGIVWVASGLMAGTSIILTRRYNLK